MKLKLNIQRFSSTNATTHYELSQYIGTDKPTYLVDYNGDMSKIDTGIYNAQSKANTNETSIGTLSSLTTDAQSNLVSAINEVDAHADTNAENIATNTTNIATNTSAIGTIVNLNTTNKSNLVNAINEVKEESDINKNNIDKFNFTNFKNYQSNEITTTTGSIIDCYLSVATNNDGSIGKIYGDLILNLSNVTGNITLKLQSSLRPSTNINVNSLGISELFTNAGVYGIFSQGLTIKTNGEIEFSAYVDATITGARFIFHPCLLFMKDFGDSNN